MEIILFVDITPGTESLHPYFITWATCSYYPVARGCLLKVLFLVEFRIYVYIASGYCIHVVL